MITVVAILCIILIVSSLFAWIQNKHEIAIILALLAAVIALLF